MVRYKSLDCQDGSCCKVSSVIFYIFLPLFFKIAIIHIQIACTLSQRARSSYRPVKHYFMYDYVDACISHLTAFENAIKLLTECIDMLGSSNKVSIDDYIAVHNNRSVCIIKILQLWI